MSKLFNISEEEKSRIRGLHLTESKNEKITLEHDTDKCENCENDYQWKEVPSGWDEEYCENCNKDHNTYKCRNCNEDVDTPDSWCSKECYDEYGL